MRPLRKARMKDEGGRMKESATRQIRLSSSSLILPPYSKELLHQFPALGCQHSFDHFHAMVQLTGITDLKMRFDRARLFVRCAINQQLHPRLDQRSGAH